MAQTKPKAAQFFGVIGHGTDGYFLMTNSDGTMTWSEVATVVNPTISSVDYPGSATAADPVGGESITINGTGFITGASVTIGGAAAGAVSFVSATELTITTPAKAAGDYDIVVTNTDGGSATSINGISYNGIPAWTTAAGSLGTFASDTTISTITLQATEPDSGTITFSITNGTLPTGLSLSGADIDGTTTLETSDTLYTFTVTATDDESQATPRTFTITVTKQFISTENFTINTYTGNGSTQSIEGKIGTAADFNGSSSYIDNTDTSLWSSNITISAWFRTSNNTQRNPIVHIGRGSWTDGFELQVPSSNTVGFSFAEGSKYGYFNSSIDLDDGNFHHYVQVSNSTTAKFYIDGVEQTGITTGTGNSRQGSGIRIGRFFQTPEQWAKGTMDQVRIFNKELSSSEVTTLYGESNTSTTKSTTDIFDDGSGVALYEFEKGAIDTGGVTGYIGSGGVFNGSSSYINLGSASSLVSTDFSFSAWVKTTSTSTDFIVGTNVNPNYSKVAVRSEGDGRIRCFHGNYTSNESGFYSTFNTINNGNWHHIVYFINQSTAKLYINGSLDTTHTLTVTPTTNGNLTLASYYNDNNNSYSTGTWEGSIDQVRIFNKELSSSEVTTLYGETSVSATRSTTDIFGDSSGVALYELEGNANDTGRGAIDSGQSAVFNGSSSVITLPSALSDGVTTTAQTISFWFYIENEVTSSTPGDEIMTFAGTSSVDGKVALGSTTGNFTGETLSVTGNLTNSYNYIKDSIPAGWNHVVLQWETNKWQVYLNGSSKTMFTFGTPVQNKWKLKFGNRSSFYFNGKLDDIRIYSDQLTSGEINAIFNNTTASIPTDYIAYYKLDGNGNDETTNYNATSVSNVTYSEPAKLPKYNGTATNVTYAYNGTPTNVSFVGTSFQPDLVWIKKRSSSTNADHMIFDSVRGADKVIISNSTQAEYDGGGTGYQSSFDSNGFSLTGNAFVNQASQTFVAWCFKGGGAAVSNTDGDNNSAMVSANTDAGFSIIKYTGDGTNNSSVGHSLNSTPEMFIYKRTSSSGSWNIVHKDVNNYKAYLEFDTGAANNDSSMQSPTDSVIRFNTNSPSFNGSSQDWLIYAFHSVNGYSKIGSYTGNGGSQTISVGFQPRFVIIKRATGGSSNGWVLSDSLRGAGINLFANTSQTASNESAYGPTSFTSDGFTLANGGGNTNASSSTYIYLAIA